LGTPFLIFGPRRVRLAAFVAFVALQALIAVTGNYAFFNLLAAALCMFMLEDKDTKEGPDVGRAPRGVHRAIVLAHRAFVTALAAIVFPVSAYRFAASVGVLLPGGPLIEPVASFIEPFRSVNSYGLFAVMTTTRPE